MMEFETGNAAPKEDGLTHQNSYNNNNPKRFMTHRDSLRVIRTKRGGWGTADARSNNNQNNNNNSSSPNRRNSWRRKSNSGRGIPKHSLHSSVADFMKEESSSNSGSILDKSNNSRHLTLFNLDEDFNNNNNDDGPTEESIPLPEVEDETEHGDTTHNNSNHEETEEDLTNNLLASTTATISEAENQTGEPQEKTRTPQHTELPMTKHNNIRSQEDDDDLDQILAAMETQEEEEEQNHYHDSDHHDHHHHHDCFNPQNQRGDGGLLAFLVMIPILGRVFRRRTKDIVVDEDDDNVMVFAPRSKRSRNNFQPQSIMITSSTRPVPPPKQQQPVDSDTHSTVSTALSVPSNHGNDNKNAKRVRFDMAYFHEHYIIPGDNPSCSHGIPLTIDWKSSRDTFRDLSEDQAENESNNAEEMEDRADTALENAATPGQEQEREIEPSDSEDSPVKILGPTRGASRRRNTRNNNDDNDNHNNNNNNSASFKATTGDLYLHPMERELRLRNAGYSRKEIHQLTVPVDVARQQRSRTIQTLNLEPFHEAWETTRRSVRSVFRSKHERRRRRQLKQWASAPSILALGGREEEGS